jgi:hypothetical protein
MIFLESMSNQLESKIQKLQKTTPTVIKSKERSSLTLLSDEHLDRHLDELNNKNSKSMRKPTITRKKSFFECIFGRK